MTGVLDCCRYSADGHDHRKLGIAPARCVKRNESADPYRIHSGVDGAVRVDGRGLAAAALIQREQARRRKCDWNRHPLADAHVEHVQHVGNGQLDGAFPFGRAALDDQSRQCPADRRDDQRAVEQGRVALPGGSEPAPDLSKPVSPWDRRLAWLFLPLFLLAPLLLWVKLSRYVAVRPLVRVTAHRGHSHAAPENTLVAVRKAIASGADYAEVDVQLTADGVVVLLHDRDLKRVAGDPRRLDDLTYDQVRRLDVGRWFDPSFAGERVPRTPYHTAAIRNTLHGANSTSSATAW